MKITLESCEAAEAGITAMRAHLNAIWPALEALGLKNTDGLPISAHLMAAQNRVSEQLRELRREGVAS